MLKPPLPPPQPLTTPPLVPTQGLPQADPNATYSSGRGYRRNPRPVVGGAYHGRSGKGFWEGRPELSGDALSYDRMKIRPTTVPRGGGSTLIGQAAAIAMAEYVNYRKGGGKRGVEERMARGGMESARMWDAQQEFNQRRHFEEDDDEWEYVGNMKRRKPQQEAPTGQRASNPNAPVATGDPFGEPPVRRSLADEQAEWEASHPAGNEILNDLTKGGTRMPTVGSVVGTVVRTAATRGGRARARQAWGEMKMGGVPTGSADPFEDDGGVSAAHEWYRQQQEAGNPTMEWTPGPDSPYTATPGPNTKINEPPL